MENKVSRRSFLKGLAAVAASLLLPKIRAKRSEAKESEETPIPRFCITAIGHNFPGSNQETYTLTLDEIRYDKFGYVGHRPFGAVVVPKWGYRYRIKEALYELPKGTLIVD